VNYMNRRERRINISFENLMHLKKIFDDAGIFFWLGDGLLLGLYRDGNMIEHDENDIDCGFWGKDIQKVIDCLPKLNEFFRVRLTRVKSNDGSIVLSLKRNPCVMHVHSHFLEGDVVYKRTAKIYNRAMVFPKKVYENFSTIEWRGVKFNCPSNIELYLETRYGKTWRVKMTKADGWTSYTDKSLNPNYHDDWPK